MPKPTIEDLIKVGAFDSICSNWSLLISQLDSLLTSNKRRSHGKQNEMSLLDEIGSKNPTDTSSQSIDAALRQHYELDLLGLPLSRHPLDSLDGRIKGITKIKDLKKLPANLRVKLAVGVIRYQTPPIWDGTRVVYICAADETGIVDITLFSDAQERSGEALFKAGWLLVEGIVQRRGLHALSVIAYRITALQYPASRLSENRLGNHT
jgi:error-prone DNA polymerase